MANLTAPLDVQLSEGYKNYYLLAASTKVFAGSAIAINASGYAIPIIGGTANQNFVGIALESVDNSAGANGALGVKVMRKPGMIVYRNASALTQASVGLTAYATDDNTITTTAGTNTAIGSITDYISATACKIAIKPTA